MSRYLELFRSGLAELRRGNPDEITSWIREQAAAALSEPRLLTVTDDGTDLPSWMSANRPVATIQDGDAYYLTLSGAFEGSMVELEPPRPVTTLAFTLSNVADADECKAVVRVEYEDGERHSRTVSFRNGLYDEVFNHLPNVLTFDRPVVSATVEATEFDSKSEGGLSDTLASAIGGSEHDASGQPKLSIPSVSPSGDDTDESHPPIVLVSVDTFRHDYVEELRPAIDALGDDVIVPDEPRTQGFFTTPSHASMFTGLQPGDHRHVEADPDDAPPIHPEMATLGELLAENQYRCSGLVSHTRLLPNYGFGRGFHRWELGQKKPAAWMADEGSARRNVDRVCQWIDEDLTAGSDRLCYFLHLFDPHPPFYPPLPVPDLVDHDFASIEAFLDIQGMSAPQQDYLELLEADPAVDGTAVDYVDRIYRHALRYTGDQLRRLFEHMDRAEILDDALVVVTGDHGYEFFERGFSGAKTLYDANIRQGMFVKPPADADWTVPEDPDLIDLLPTVARAVGADVPDGVQGRAWQATTGEQDRIRITERIRPNWYCLACESGDTKAIYTYDSNNPDRPTADQVADGPVHEEYYRLSRVRDGQYGDVGDELSADVKRRLRTAAEDFITQERAGAELDERRVRARPDQETEELLEQLGYK
jgi:hypothetical protein